MSRTCSQSLGSTAPWDDNRQYEAGRGGLQGYCIPCLQLAGCCLRDMGAGDGGDQIGYHLVTLRRVSSRKSSLVHVASAAAIWRWLCARCYKRSAVLPIVSTAERSLCGTRYASRAMCGNLHCVLISTVRLRPCCRSAALQCMPLSAMHKRRDGAISDDHVAC